MPKPKRTLKVRKGMAHALGRINVVRATLQTGGLENNKYPERVGDSRGIGGKEGFLNEIRTMKRRT